MDRYFKCKDDKFCIFDNLVCDGHLQCEDGSDEECTVCPPVNHTLQRRRTFPCKHRYTGYPICANPCDGYDDLCEDYTDEDCEGSSVFQILFWVASLTIVVSVTMIIIEKCMTIFAKDVKKTVYKPNTIYIMYLDNDINTKNLNGYMKTRNCEDFVNQMSMILLSYKSKKDIANAKTLTRLHHIMELSCYQSKTECVDEYYFKIFGTNELTSYIYDILDNSLSIKIDLFMASKCPKFVATVFATDYFKMATIYVLFIVRIVLHYADFVKDIVLLRKIWTNMLANSTRTFLEDISEFPAAVFCIILISIVITELLTIYTFITSSTFKGYDKSKKGCSLLLFPLIPSIVLHQTFKLELKQMFMLSKVNPTNYNINYHYKTCKKDIKSLLSLRSNLRYNENVAEHFPRLVVLILILILRKTATPTVAQMDKIILNNNEIFMLLSTSWSFVSLLKGQLFYIKATKDNSVRTLGQIIALLYFAIGLTGRLLSIVFFFTPLLGLFDTNYHGIFGSISLYKYFKDNKKLFYLYDYIGHNKATSFAETIRVRVPVDSPILWIDMYIPSADAWHRQRRELCH
jgi:hypothetical protein